MTQPILIGILVAIGTWWTLALLAPSNLAEDPDAVMLVSAICALCFGVAAGLAA